VLDLAAVLVDFDRADTNRKAGALAPAFLGIKLAVDDDDARAGDRVTVDRHFVLPFASTSQIS
jgi:hypothetical protein